MYTSNIERHIPFLRYAGRRAKRLLELGVETGEGSTRAFAEAFRGELWVSVDKEDKMTFKPSSDKWHLVLGDTRKEETVEKVREFPGLKYFDTVLVDTRHTYEHLDTELNLWGSFVKEDGLWIFHDTFMEGRYNHMTDRIKEFAAEKGCSYYDYDFENNGLGVVFKEDK